jgi:alpha-N-arabinofuranosidase
MSKKTFARLATLAVAFMAVAATLAQTPTAKLTIHADQPVSKVSPTLYGLMTEEINFSYEGGLYAEMVRNRTFGGDWSGILHWYLIEDGNAQATMTADRQTGPSDAIKSSLKLDIKQADEHNQAGVLNEGWWGMPLRPNATYKGSFYAKSGSSDLGAVTVSLVGNQSGKAVATAQVSSIGTDWMQHEFSLKTGAIESSAANHLVITVGHPGTLWLSLV